MTSLGEDYGKAKAFALRHMVAAVAIAAVIGVVIGGLLF
jgi:hypothetical protein